MQHSFACPHCGTRNHNDVLIYQELTTGLMYTQLVCVQCGLDFHVSVEISVHKEAPCAE